MLEYMTERKSENETTDGEKAEVGGYLREHSDVLKVSQQRTPAWGKSIAQESSEMALVRDEETGLKLGARKTSPLLNDLGNKRKVNGETLRWNNLKIKNIQRSCRWKSCLLYTSDAADE